MKRKKFLIVIAIIFSIVLLISILIFLKPDKINNSNIPRLILEGNAMITIQEGEQYIEPGFHAIDTENNNLTSKVKVEGRVDEDTPGIYELIYKVTNSWGKTVMAKRIVKVEKKKKFEYNPEFDKIDNAVKSWGTNNKKDGTRPIIDISNEELRKYDAYAMGPDEKVIYLTFDEGTMKTYLPNIVEVLNKNSVKGTFFLCKNYIKNNGELIKNMVKEGHSIGNHTASHPSMPTLATEEKFDKFLEEILDTERTFKEITGNSIDPIYREPRGEYSLRSLSIMKALGYKTYFWSAAYKDWDDNLTKEEALKSMIDRVHPGAIYLLHPTSKGNYLALDDFIKKMKQEGYKFDLVKNIP